MFEWVNVVKKQNNNNKKTKNKKTNYTYASPFIFYIRLQDTNTLPSRNTYTMQAKYIIQFN